MHCKSSRQEGLLMMDTGEIQSMLHIYYRSTSRRPLLHTYCRLVPVGGWSLLYTYCRLMSRVGGVTIDAAYILQIDVKMIVAAHILQIDDSQQCIRWHCN